MERYEGRAPRRSAGSVALVLAEMVLGVFVGWEIGILPMRFSPWWVVVSGASLVVLAALGVRLRSLRPLLWTSAAVTGMAILYSIALSVTLGSMS